MKRGRASTTESVPRREPGFPQEPQGKPGMNGFLGLLSALDQSREEVKEISATRTSKPLVGADKAGMPIFPLGSESRLRS